MSETTTVGTELTSQYAAQVTSDLERNAKEQQRISAEIAALQEQLPRSHSRTATAPPRASTKTKRIACQIGTPEEAGQQ
ncbi:hypothetical protein ABZ876_12090 [Streptomyces sp. NPDC046931]|uniref:hypothetical protein n=1 Tax=Streptomyces sp. NPDC046931 TaxID=3154806 RepID=UPI00340C5DF7